MPSKILSTLVLATSIAAVSGAFAQSGAPSKGDFQPYSGQPGKDVVWVPTPESVVNRMLDLARVTAKDFVVDLGSGDGRTVITAAKRGARAMGVEYNPDMVALSNREAAKAGVTDKVKFVNGDIFGTDFKDANVVTLYLLPSLNVKLRPTLLEMRPGTRIASHAFNMADWEPDETANIEGRQAFLWVVPAKVGGTWNIQTGGNARDVSLQQTFQMLSGTGVSDGRMRGDEIRFSLTDGGVKREFTGRVQGNSMSGTVKTAGQPDANWSATRR